MEEVEDLVLRARAGDLDAYARLVRRFRAGALEQARRACGDYHLAEDAVQEAFVAAYRDLGQLRQPAAFAGWLRRVVARQCQRMFRRRREESGDRAQIEALASAAPDPARSLELAELRRRIAAAIERLPARERQIFTLFYVDDMTQSDIAALLNIPQSTANSRLYTSRRRLREELGHMERQQQFVHLRGRSEYSLPDGGCRVDDRVAAAAGGGMPALALADRANLFAAVRHYDACRAAGIKPVVGCLLEVESFPVVLLAADDGGYRHLVQLVSQAHLDGPQGAPGLGWPALAARAEGLVCLSGGRDGALARALARGDGAGAERWAKKFRALFGRDYYLEIQRHGQADEDQLNARLASLGRELGIPLVATHDFRVIERGEAAAASHPSLYMKSAAEMRELFADWPEALANTLAIAEQCTLRRSLELGFGAWHLPAVELPGGYDAPLDYLRALAAEGLAARCPPDDPRYAARLEAELAAIASAGYEAYFLIVADYVRFARDEGIMVGPGRGSSAGCLLNFCLGITDIDPLAHDLLFERFLNVERQVRPDIDVDIAPEGRERIIDYLISRYGEASVSRVAHFGRLDAHGALRGVGRAFAVAAEEVEAVVGLVPAAAKPLAELVAEDPALRRLAGEQGVAARLLSAARRLEGMVNEVCEHAGSVIVAPGPLADIVPLYRDGQGRATTQYDARTCEGVDLMKIDLLPVRELGLLQEAVAWVRSREEGFSLTGLGLADAETLAVFGRGETVGVFQFEELADTLRDLRPDRFGHLVDVLALNRPGAMRQIPAYIARRHGAAYDLPAPLRPLLAATYGLCIYQEQIAQAGQALAGFTPGQADNLRRGLGKGAEGEVAALREAFMAGAGGVGQAEGAFEALRESAGLAFNRSHAVAYALIGYWCAYLKAHQPRHFMAAALNAHRVKEPLVAECRRLGLAVHGGGARFEPVADGVKGPRI